METAWEEQERRERRRVAWGATAVAGLMVLPLQQIHGLALIGAYFGWFLHLLDVHLTAMASRRPVSYGAGWTLLGAAVAASLLHTKHAFWWNIPFWSALLWLVWRAWKDARA